MENPHFETKLLHVPYKKTDTYHALAMPVYHTAAYEFDTAEAMEAAFCGHSSDPTYSRITNPTVQYFEDRIRSITDALSVTALNSGMAAINHVIMTLAYTGSNIVASPHLFGNTYSSMKNIWTNFGIEIRFCNLLDPDEVRSRIDERTCAIFVEIITNPQMEVADLKMLSAIGQEKKVPLVADTTVVPFCAFNAREFGIHIEVVSTTKYISGGATSIGGLVLDHGTFDWSSSKMLKAWNAKAGKKAFTERMQKEMVRNIGSYMTPQVAYMQMLGMETLQLRFKQQAATCLETARRLQSMKEIISVNYPGLENNPFYAISNAQFGKYPGAMLTFDLSSREACFSFINHLRMIRRATNLFDNKTLIIHPASTIYGTFSEEQRREMGIRQQTLRLSVGLEPAEDLFQDIQQALCR